MASSSANVTAVDAVRRFKVALQLFAADADGGLTALELEVRRAVDWIEQDRSRYWPHQERVARDSLSEARLALGRCELMASDGEPRSCYDERKAVERAKRRLELCEQKIKAVQRWRIAVKKEADEFLVEASKLRQYLDVDFLRIVGALERMAGAVERYVESRPPAAGDATTSAP